MTSQTVQRMTEIQITNANAILEYLVANAETDRDRWSEKLEELFPGDSYATVIMGIERAMDSCGIDRPFGVFVGSTATAKEGSGIDGDDAQLALQGLKDNRRIVQLGRGRGRAIVVLNNSLLEAGSILNIRQVKTRPEADDAVANIETPVAAVAQDSRMTW